MSNLAKTPQITFTQRWGGIEVQSIQNVCAALQQEKKEPKTAIDNGFLGGGSRARSKKGGSNQKTQLDKKTRLRAHWHGDRGMFRLPLCIYF
jgi:hypothetical protein